MRTLTSDDTVDQLLEHLASDGAGGQGKPQCSRCKDTGVEPGDFDGSGSTHAKLGNAVAGVGRRVAEGASVDTARASSKSGNAQRAKLEATSKLWLDLKANQANLEAARAAGDTDAMRKLLSQQGKLIRNGAAVGELMQEVSELCQGKRKLTNSEFKMPRDMRQLMTQERVTQIIVSLASSVREHVTYPTQGRQIAYGFSLLLGPAGGGPDGSAAPMDAEFSEVPDGE